MYIWEKLEVVFTVLIVFVKCSTYLAILWKIVFIKFPSQSLKSNPQASVCMQQFIKNTYNFVFHAQLQLMEAIIYIHKLCIILYIYSAVITHSTVINCHIVACKFLGIIHYYCSIQLCDKEVLLLPKDRTIPFIAIY